jgi:S1-C subfamily serine protease
MRTFLSAQRYPALLTFLSIGILVVGMLVKPKKANTEAVVSESETMRLEQIAQKRSLQDMTAFLAGVAGNTGAHVVYVPQAAATGIVWNSRGEIVTAGPGTGSSPASVVLPDGKEVMAEWQRAEAPVAALQIAGGSAFPSVSAVDPAATAPASWILQVSRRQDGSLFFTPGLHRGIRPVTCGEAHYREVDTSIDLTTEMAGGGLFDLEGQLLAMLVRCDGSVIALPVADVEQALHPPENPVGAMERHWGMKAARLDGAAQKYFNAEKGLLIQEVRNNGLAARTGFIPGDVVLAFRAETVGSLEDFLHLASGVPAEGTKVEVLRRGRRRILSVAGPDHPGGVPSDRDGEIGIKFESPPAGYAVEKVAAGSAAERAGIRLGDRLLEVNGSKIRRYDDLGRLLKKSRDGLQYLVLSRGERQIGILLP